MSVIKIRRGTTQQWAASNRVLQLGELGLDTTLNKLKAGNGSTAWSSLAFLQADADVTELAQDAVATALANGTHSNITVTYSDNGNSISLATGPDVITQTSLSNTLTNATDGYVSVADVGLADGVASLDATGKVPDSEIPTAIAKLASPTFTGTPAAPTATAGTNTTQVATTAFVGTAVSNLVNAAPESLNTLKELSDALGADANFATTTATSIGNKVSKAGGDTIQSSLASTIPLVLKGAASQTANLQQWQNSAGTVLASINSGGSLTLTNSGANGIGGLSAGVMWYVVSGSSGYRPLVVQAATSQSANLTTWQDSSGVALSAISAYGSLGLNSVPSTTVWLIIKTGTASLVGQVIQGAASQTADLQQWQNSAGTVLATVSNVGTIKSGAFASPTDLGAYINFNSTSGAMLVGTRAAANVGVIIKGEASQTANLQEWQTSAGTVESKIDATGQFISKTCYLSTAFIGGGISGTIGQANVSPFQPSRIGLVVRGTASQTANLQQWENSSGTILSKVDASGAMFTITPTAGANTTQVATTEFVRGEVAALVNSAGSTLDTLGEIATALGNDANLSTTLTTSIGLKAPIASPTFTGTVAGITKSMVGLANVDNTTDANKPVSTATQTALDLKLNLSDPITINSKSSSYTISPIDSGRLIEMSAGGTLTITDSASFPIGFTVDVLQTGSSQVTIAGTSFTPNATPGLKLRTQWSSATLIKRGLNSWVVLGDLSA